jgi:hypothetical protein
MYEGGYWVVEDASKFFHQFLTHPEDQPYLGLKHPAITGILYVYQGTYLWEGRLPQVPQANLDCPY